MADYYSVLSNAVSALGPDAADQRRAIYDRARRALLDRLRAAEPPISDMEIEVERAALETAIQRLELTLRRRVPLSRAADPVPLPSYGGGRPLRSSRKKTYLAVAAATLVAFLVALFFAYDVIPGKRSAKRVEQRAERRGEQPVGRLNYVYLQQIVYYRSPYPAGTIVVDKAQHFLYVVRPNVAATRYGIGNGPECADAAGLYRVLGKDATPAIRFGETYRFHEAASLQNIGRSAPGGCFQLTENDIKGLYTRVPVETRVVVMN